MDYMESIKKLEEKLTINQQKHATNGEVKTVSSNKEVEELKKMLQHEVCLRKAAEDELYQLKSQLELAGGSSNSFSLQHVLEEEIRKKTNLEEQVTVLRSQLAHLSIQADQTRSYQDGNIGDRASITNLHEQVGLQKILSLLESEDANVRIHAVKVVANLAAKEANQEKIAEAGGLTSLLMLLRTYEDETISRIAAGAIANLAMNEANQELIMGQGGISLLAMTATDAEDPQTLRMVAGAMANLCGNDKLQIKLISEGGIKLY